MTEVVRRALVVRDGLRAVAEWERHHGTLTDAEMDEARRPARRRRAARVGVAALGVTVIYDSGVLVAADRDDREVWADHRARLELGVVPVTTAPVVAQVSRSPRRVQLRRLLRGCEVVAFAADQAHEVGALLERAKLSDASAPASW